MSRSRITLLRTHCHECAYVSGRTARLEFLSPTLRLNDHRYQLLLEQGFRRSGPYVYRPHCPGCKACQSLRIPVARFRPRRRHRRCQRANANLHVTACPPVMTQEHLALYRRYIDHRHPRSSMANPDHAEAEGFLAAPWCTTVFYELRTEAQGSLLAVAVTDVLPDALSAVYTFYAPEAEHRGLGNLAVLWQLSEARRLGAQHLYLGYWIADAPAMAYKASFRPHEIFDGRGWRAQE
ncbi:arginyltransferase [Halorhodospira halophila]|uniref:Aspartate/glutamate leucyltransferase n=1 Tax=Halorhodospira halophila (strain DSM 244 / SL1) TaxID=349124 RepID=BPT_HALHL|nr:arginyltransferase [Halorhodospira halophila]A1WWV3.1 RecName: Full=Aspartate/glutamate leucyltransferase [Halorhodospira halophila SL1]ABM62165.1 Arginyltransferase [Halorhodospira halophila SL1]MBK1729493.1 arginyltransferase [Halorhodospira halophila]